MTQLLIGSGSCVVKHLMAWLRNFKILVIEATGVSLVVGAALVQPTQPSAA